MNNNNNNNKTKFILNYQTPFLHYLLSFLMIIIAVMLIIFSLQLFQYKEKIIENNINIQKQYLNDLKLIKQHKICKIYDNNNNQTLSNLTENLHNEYSKYSLKFDFTNSHFVENYNNYYLIYFGQLSLKFPDNFSNSSNDLLHNIQEKFPGVLQYQSCFLNENNNELYCQISLNLYAKNICL